MRYIVAFLAALSLLSAGFPAQAQEAGRGGTTARCAPPGSMSILPTCPCKEKDPRACKYPPVPHEPSPPRK